MRKNDYKIIYRLMILLIAAFFLTSSLLPSISAGQGQMDDKPDFLLDQENGASGAVMDLDESFQWVNYSAYDSSGDGLNDSVKARFGVVTQGLSEEVQVNMTVTNSTGAVVKTDFTQFVARRRAVNITNLHFDFTAGKTDNYNIYLTLIDTNHNTVEDDHNNTNISLFFQFQRYDIHLDTFVSDLNGNGSANDVKIICLDSDSLPVENATILLDGWEVGRTDARGNLTIFNVSGHHREIDAFYSIAHANTDIDIEANLPGLMIVDPDPEDNDGDGYNDDVKAYVRLADGSPAVGATVDIGWNRAFVNARGFAQFNNLTDGPYDVWVTYLGNLYARSYFYSEGITIVEYDMYFYSIYTYPIDADGDGKENDLEIYCDVDISDGVTAEVNINATLYDNYAYKIGFANTSYVTTGYDVEKEFFYLYDLEDGVYTLRFELFDSNWTLRDASTQTEIAVGMEHTLVNVEKMVDDMDGGGNMNDIMFYAHIWDRSAENITVRTYYYSNDTLYNESITDEWGMVELFNLPEDKYYFHAYKPNRQFSEYGNFTIYTRFPRAFQTMEFLTDADWDGDFDDFMIYAYDSFGMADQNTYVEVWDEFGWRVDDGMTNDPQYGPGYFIAYDVDRWEDSNTFTFSAQHITPQFTTNVTNGTFFTDLVNSVYYLPLFIETRVYDANGTGLEDDVEITVTDMNGNPAVDAEVEIHNTYYSEINNYWEIWTRTDNNGKAFYSDLPGGEYKVYAFDYFNNSRGNNKFNSRGSLGMLLDSFTNARTLVLNDDLIRDDIDLTFEIKCSAFGWENITIITNISYESNGTVFKLLNETMMSDIDIYYQNYVFNIPFGNYSVSIKLYDENNTLRDQKNIKNLRLYESERILNTGITFYSYWNEIFLAPRYIDVYNLVSNFTLKNSTGIVDISSFEWHSKVYYDLYPDTYQWFVNETRFGLNDSGEFLIDMNYGFDCFLSDEDNEGYYDDFTIFVYDRNGSDIENAIVTVWDANGLPFTSGRTTGGKFALYNLSKGNYTYTLTHNRKTLLSGDFYSYTNGYMNHPPVANISHPRNDSTFMRNDNVYFDAGNSSDSDVNDTIHFTWVSDKEGVLSHAVNFNTTSLSPGVHTITLYCDDAHEQNVSTSIIITILTPNILPTANAGEDIVAFINETVELLGSAWDEDGSIVRYKWDFDGDGIFDWNQTSNQMVAYTYAELGLYHPVFWIMDDRGDVDEDTINITVTYRNSPPVPRAGEELDVFTGDKCILNGTGSYDPNMNYGDLIVTYGWNCTSHFNFSLNQSDSPEPHFTPTMAGIYTFKLSVKDINGAWSLWEDTVNVTVTDRPNVRPVAKAGPDRMGYLGDSFVLDARGSRDTDGEIVEYLWRCDYPEDAAPDTGEPNFTFTPLDDSAYNFSLRVRDDDDAWSLWDFVNISVVETNLKPIAEAVPVSQAEVFEPVILKSTGSYDPNDDMNDNGIIDYDESDNLYYQWDIDGDNKTDITGRTTSYVYTETGTFKVTLKVTDQGTDTDPEPLWDSDYFQILVKVKNSAPVAHIDQEDGMIAEEGEKVSLSAYDTYDEQEDSDGDGILSISELDDLEIYWDMDLATDMNDDGIPDNDIDGIGVTFDPRYSEYGDYSIGLTVTDGEGASSTDEIEIIINAVPTDPVLFIQPIQDNYYQDQIITFSADSDDPDGKDSDLEYQWDMDSDGIVDANGEDIEHSYEASGNYMITITVVDKLGSFSTSKNTISILPPIQIMVGIPTILTPQSGMTFYGEELAVEARSPDSMIMYLEISLNQRSWMRMDQEGDSDIWKHKYNIFQFAEVESITIYVRGALRDHSGSRVYTESDDVSFKIGSSEDDDSNEYKSFQDMISDNKMVFIALIGFILFILILMFILRSGRKDRRDELLVKGEIEGKKKKKTKRKDKKGASEVQPLEIEALDDSDGSQIDEEGKAVDKGRNIDIQCPGCDNTFTQRSTGRWPLIMKCPSCGATGKITVDMLPK